MSALLWTLLALFVLRVAGQAMVAFFDVTWLPPMERWHSGLVPYGWLLAAQVAILVLMGKICSDFTRRRGFFVRPRRFFAASWLWFGYIYLAGMVVRFLIQGPTIPVFFHWILAAFVIAVGLWHRRQAPA